LPYDFYMPDTVCDALQILDSHQGPLKVLAGGTDLILALRQKKIQPKGIVDLSGVSQLKQVKVEGNRISIGSLVTFSQIASIKGLGQRASLLVEAALDIGSPQIRNQGTIGGNIANASPAADIVPPLLVLEAVAVIESCRGSREVPVAELLAGAGCTNLTDDEIITEIRFDLPAPEAKSTFRKFGRRNALAIARISTAMLVIVENNVVKEAKLALGAVAPNPFRAPELEAMLRGQALSTELLEEVIQASGLLVGEKLGKRPSAIWKKEAIKGLMRETMVNLHLMQGVNRDGYN
jgi:CO/xanthine dehydrogenase FAD-binding subunit